MKAYIEGLLRAIDLNGRMPGPVAGRHLILGRAGHLTTNVGVRTSHRELASLRYWALLQAETQHLVECEKSGSFAELPIFAVVFRT